jgi:long-chain acyl-CoA synthetase
MIRAHSVFDLLERKSQRHPEQLSLGHFQNGELNFLSNLDIQDRVTKIANRFNSIKEGRPNLKLGILHKTSVDWHLFDLGAMLSKTTVVGLPQGLTNKEYENLIEHAEIDTLLVDSYACLSQLLNSEILRQKIKIVITSCHHSFKEFCEKGIIEAVFHARDFQYYDISSFKNFESFLSLKGKIKSNDLATIIYTSGTSAQPKGVCLTHSALVQSLKNIKSSIGKLIGPQDRSLVNLPLYHILGRCDSLLYLTQDHLAVFCDSTKKVLEYAKIVNPSFIITFPRFLYMVQKKAGTTNRLLRQWMREYCDQIDENQIPRKFSRLKAKLAYEIYFSKIKSQFGQKLKFIVSGGSPLPSLLFHFFRFANIPIIEGYGLTEASGPVTLCPIGHPKQGSVGRPFGDVEIHLAEDGEIFVKTKALMQGYYKDEEATKLAITEDGWFKTGDLGEFDSDGFLKITDRKKDIIFTSSGVMISPAKVESHLKSLKYIDQAMVIGDEKPYLTAIITPDLNSFEQLSEEVGPHSYQEFGQSTEVYEKIAEEIELSNSELPEYEKIRKFRIAPIPLTIESGLITPSMKVKRQFIYNKFKPLIDSMYHKL